MDDARGQEKEKEDERHKERAIYSMRMNSTRLMAQILIVNNAFKQCRGAQATQCQRRVERKFEGEGRKYEGRGEDKGRGEYKGMEEVRYCIVFRLLRKV